MITRHMIISLLIERGHKMNILFLSIGGLRNLGDNAVYPDLLRYISGKNHNVYVICQSERREGEPTTYEVEHGINVLRVKSLNITKTNVIEKGFATLLIPFLFKRAIKKYLSKVSFDLVLYTTPPITFNSVISDIKKRDNSRTYLMLKDIFPQNAVDLGLLTKKGLKGLVYSYFRSREKKIYKLSDRIGCMSKANIEYILANNIIDKDKVELCPNTINLAKPLEIKKDDLKSKYGIPKEKIVLVYGGNFGKPQNVKFICEVIKSNEMNSDFYFLMIGNGTEFYRIRKLGQDLDNVTVIGSMKKNEYFEMLVLADVGLIFLDDRFTIPNYPSRVLDYMNFSLPVFACTDSNTDFGEDILEGEYGFWVSSNNIDKFNKTLLKASDKNLLDSMGRNSQKFLKENFLTEVAYNKIFHETDVK